MTTAIVGAGLSFIGYVIVMVWQATAQDGVDAE